MRNPSCWPTEPRGAAEIWTLARTRGKNKKSFTARRKPPERRRNYTQPSAITALEWFLWRIFCLFVCFKFSKIEILKKKSTFVEPPKRCRCHDKNATVQTLVHSLLCRLLQLTKDDRRVRSCRVWSFLISMFHIKQGKWSSFLDRAFSLLAQQVTGG